MENWASCVHYAIFCCFKDSLGGTLHLGNHTLESRDYWLDNSQDVNVLEAQALLYYLLFFREHLTSSRVDVHTDNHVLKSALENGGCRSSEVNGILKDLMFTTFPQVKIWLTSVLEADRMRILCCQAALGSKLNAFWAPHVWSHVPG